MAVPLGRVTTWGCCVSLAETAAGLGVAGFAAVALAVGLGAGRLVASVAGWLEQPAVEKRPRAAAASDSLRYRREWIIYTPPSGYPKNGRRWPGKPLRRIKLRNRPQE